MFNLLQRFSHYLWIAFLVLLPFQTVWLWREPVIEGTKWQYGTIGIYGTDILLVLVLLFASFSGFHRISFLTVKSFEKRYLMKPFITLLIIILVVYSGLSIFWAGNKVLAGYFTFKLFLATSVFYCVRATDVGKRIFMAVFAVAFLESVLGMWQFLSQSSFASSLLGVSGYEPWQPGVSVLKNESGRWLRAYGTFPHPNMFGAYFGVVSLVLMSAFTLFGGIFSLRRYQNYEIFHSKKYFFTAESSTPMAFEKNFFEWNIVMYSLAILSFIALILSFSRSAWLGVALGFLTLAVKVLWQGNTEQKQNLKKISLVIGMAMAVFVGILHEVVFPRFESATIEREASVIDRTVLINQAIGIIKEHPVFGVGAGNYTLAVMQKYQDLPVWDAQPVHNVFLLVFAELGFVGFILFILFLVSVFYTGLKNLLSKNPQENVVFFIAFISLIPSLFLDHFLWDSHFGLFVLFLITGLMAMKRVQSE